MNKNKAVLPILFLLVCGALVSEGCAQPSRFLVNNVTAYQPQIGNFTCSESFVTPDRIFTLSCIINDLNGKETLQNATVELSEGIILFWKNETDKFSLIQNLNNYARLESGSYSDVVKNYARLEYGSYSEARNSSALTLNFLLSFRVNMTSGAIDIIPENTKVYDNSSLCGYGNHTALFSFGPAPEAWQQNPSDIPQPGHVIGFKESVAILIVSLVIIVVASLFSKRKKSTQEKYNELIKVQPKERK